VLAVEVREHVARLVLRNPPGNRFSHALLDGFERALGDLASQADVRAAWLSADGPDFSHGADLHDPAIQERMTDGAEARAAFAGFGASLVERWSQLPFPTVVSARGRVVGAGACFLFASDFRVLAPGATVRFPEVDRGMHLSWGIVPRLVAELGPTLAKRLAVLGEAVPAEALGGHVEIAEDPDSRAETIATALAGKPPLALRSTLRMTRAAARGEPFDPAEDARLFAETAGTEDFVEAVAAFLEKRPGRYQGR
jgi:enoyl-CoA hydratase/carnithine racemase